MKTTLSSSCPTAPYILVIWQLILISQGFPPTTCYSLSFHMPSKEYIQWSAMPKNFKLCSTRKMSFVWLRTGLKQSQKFVSRFSYCHFNNLHSIEWGCSATLRLDFCAVFRDMSLSIYFRSTINLNKFLPLKTDQVLLEFSIIPIFKKSPYRTTWLFSSQTVF